MTMNKNDEKIAELLKKVTAQRAALPSKPRASYITNCVVVIRGNTVNLNVLDKDGLVTSFAMFLAEDFYKVEARKRLGLVSVSKMFGSDYTLADWEADFKTRLAILDWNEKKASLDKTEAKLKALMSEDSKTASALADLEADLG